MHCLWLKQQLQTQTEGLGGHLHTFWPDIKDSQWRGGSAEGWERVPYWLDAPENRGVSRRRPVNGASSSASRCKARAGLGI